MVQYLFLLNLCYRLLPTCVGLTPDENHISPIENLDNTISRLYSYLSGSEGDVETDHPLTPPQRQEKWERRRSRSPTSIPSSRSSSMSRSDSEPERVPSRSNHLRVGTLDRGTIDRRTLDSACSAETGENVYSRINDTGKYTRLLTLYPLINNCEELSDIHCLRIESFHTDRFQGILKG